MAQYKQCVFRNRIEGIVRGNCPEFDKTVPYIVAHTPHDVTSTKT